jgi:hypothetical protein
MARTFNSGQNPLSKMNVLRAVRWGIDAWESKVIPSTIQNCWARSQAIDFRARPFAFNLWSDSFVVVRGIEEAVEAL